MTLRNYRNYGIKGAAQEIISECVTKGNSKGWCGSEEDLEQIEEICAKFNVYYVDDFFGEWKLKNN